MFGGVEQGRWRELVLLTDLMVISVLTACGGGVVEPWVEELWLTAYQEGAGMRFETKGGQHLSEITVELFRTGGAEKTPIKLPADEFPVEVEEGGVLVPMVYVMGGEWIKHCDLLDVDEQGNVVVYQYACASAAE